MTTLPTSTARKMGLVIDLDICVGCDPAEIELWKKLYHELPKLDALAGVEKPKVPVGSFNLNGKASGSTGPWSHPGSITMNMAAAAIIIILGVADLALNLVIVNAMIAHRAVLQVLVTILAIGCLLEMITVL